MLKELDIRKIFTILKFLRCAITTTCNSHDNGRRSHSNGNTERSIEDYFSAFQKTRCFLFNPFPANVPHMGKSVSWFVLAKCMKKHLCKSDIWPASLLKTSLFHRCFFTHFAGKNYAHKHNVGWKWVNWVPITSLVEKWLCTEWCMDFQMNKSSAINMHIQIWTILRFGYISFLWLF